MFTNSGFYFAWVAIAFFPLVIAIFVPETRRNRIIAILLTLVITFSFATLLYKQSKGEHDRWNNGIHLIVAANINFLVLQIIAVQKIIIILAISAGTQKNFL